MFRPQIQKTNVLAIIAVINLTLVYIAANSYEYLEKEGLETKVKATKIMSNCLNELFKINSFNEEDIYQSGIVGVDSSLITTIFESDSKKIKNSKIACTHPNFAALIVEMFQESQLSVNDPIAISMTGSLPGANLAVLSAAQAMNLKPIIISSIGSSAWGANKEDFSWLDIESFLFDNNLINFQSVAATIGGENDLGDNLSDKGIEIIENIIASKNIEFINNKSLSKNINDRINSYEKIYKTNEYKAYINVGGGASSLGFGEGKDTMSAGIIYPIEKDDIQHNGFNNSVSKYFLDNDITLINIKNISLLAKNVGLYPPDESIEINNGTLFYIKGKYNLIIIIICLIISILSIGCIGIYSHYEIKKRMQQYEPDSII